MARGEKSERRSRNPPAGGDSRRRRKTTGEVVAGETRPLPLVDQPSLAGFYAELLTPDELADLARVDAAEAPLADEVALLRVAIRRGMASGESLETIGRSVQRLAQTLKVARSLRGESLREFEEMLARVLDEIGREI
jgi:hypothetical protein